MCINTHTHTHTHAFVKYGSLMSSHRSVMYTPPNFHLNVKTNDATYIPQKYENDSYSYNELMHPK